jgi:hypothetical protein
VIDVQVPVPAAGQAEVPTVHEVIFLGKKQAADDRCVSSWSRRGRCRSRARRLSLGFTSMRSVCTCGR